MKLSTLPSGTLSTKENGGPRFCLMLANRGKHSKTKLLSQNQADATSTGAILESCMDQPQVAPSGKSALFPLWSCGWSLTWN